MKITFAETNFMITKNDITWIPAIDEPLGETDDHGWLAIDGETHRIESIHHFDDFGHELTTFTLENGAEVYMDESERFTLEME
jgi:hypothetical protein